jgi:hypothetical protein
VFEPHPDLPSGDNLQGVSWRLRRSAVLGGVSHFYALFLSKGFAPLFSGALLGFIQTRVVDNDTASNMGNGAGSGTA